MTALARRAGGLTAWQWERVMRLVRGLAERHAAGRPAPEAGR